MKILQKVGLGSAETFRGPLWLWPSVAVVVSIPVALLLSRYGPLTDRGSVLWLGDADAAKSVLQVISTSVITATTIVFSLTVLTLQLASQQFSPRLLREFNRDPVTKAVLATLAAGFAYSMTLLTTMKSDQPVPELALLVAHILGMAALFAILLFIAHITKVVRIDTIMRKVHDDTLRVMKNFYPRYDESDTASPEEAHLDQRNGHLVFSKSSGFVRMTDVKKLVKDAAKHDAIIRVEVRAGDHVSRRAPIATVWRSDRSAIDGDGDWLKSVSQCVRHSLIIDFERTFDQDAGFGFRQLEDIAVKAMSPGINDPATAATAVAHMADLLVGLCDYRLGPSLHFDDQKVGRVISPDRNMHYYLDTASSQLRRYAAAEPSVLGALMQMLRDVAVACRDEHQKNEVRRTVETVLATIDPSMLDRDAAGVHDMARRVRCALAGDLYGAYADEAGETRST